MVAIFINPEPDDDHPVPVPDQVGAGSLIAERDVLVHPPFSLELAVGYRPENLFVCATTWSTDPPESDVIAVDAVAVGAWDQNSADPALQLDPGVRRQPIVVLRLAEATGILPDPPLDSLQAYLRLLADPFNGPATDDGDHDGDFLCNVFGICW